SVRKSLDLSERSARSAARSGLPGPDDRYPASDRGQTRWPGRPHCSRSHSESAPAPSAPLALPCRWWQDVGLEKLFRGTSVPSHHKYHSGGVAGQEGGESFSGSSGSAARAPHPREDNMNHRIVVAAARTLLASTVFVTLTAGVFAQ